MDKEIEELIKEHRKFVIVTIVTIVLLTLALIFCATAKAERYTVMGIGKASYHLRCADANTDGCSGLWYQAGYDKEANMNQNSFRIGLGWGKKLSKHFVVEYTIYSDISTPVSQFDRANEWSFTYRVPLGG